MAERRYGAGFTLIEVLVALAILAVSLGTLMGVFSDVLNRTSRDASETDAVAVGRGVLDRVGIDFALRVGEQSGVSVQGYHWHLWIVPYGDAGDLAAWQNCAFDITVLIAPPSGLFDRGIKLRTMRLGGGVPPGCNRRNT